jgi:hypothetical protein
MRSPCHLDDDWIDSADAGNLGKEESLQWWELGFENPVIAGVLLFALCFNASPKCRKLQQHLQCFLLGAR